MTLSKLFKGSLVALAGLGTLLPQSAAAAPLAASALPAVHPQTQILDVALGQDGTLQGQLVDPQGQPVAGAVIKAQAGGRDVATAKTGKDGRFAIQGLRGGNYTLVAGNCGGTFRAWKAGTAPPSAHAAVLLVRGDELARGNMGGGYGGGGGPVVGGGAGALGPGLLMLGVIGGIVAGGIAAQDDESGS